MANRRADWKRVTQRVDGRKIEGNGPTLAAARADLASKLLKLNARAALDGKMAMLSFGDYAALWLTQQRSMATGTRRGYVISFARPDTVGSDFASIPVGDITTEDCEALVTALCDHGYAASTVQGTVGNIRRVLDHAVDRHVIAATPWRKIDLPANPQPDRTALPVDVVSAIFDALPVQHRALFWLLATTGLRIGEAMGLGPEHVTLDADPEVRVRRQRKQSLTHAPDCDGRCSKACDTKLLTKTTKTQRSKREVPIPYPTRDVLQWHLDSGYHGVWTDRDGTEHVLLFTRTRRAFQIALAKASAPFMHVHPHALRAFFASILLDQGESQARVAALLGDTELTLLKHYSLPTTGDADRTRSALSILPAPAVETDAVVTPLRRAQ